MNFLLKLYADMIYSSRNSQQYAMVYREYSFHSKDTTYSDFMMKKEEELLSEIGCIVQ